MNKKTNFIKLSRKLAYFYDILQLSITFSNILQFSNVFSIFL